MLIKIKGSNKGAALKTHCFIIPLAFKNVTVVTGAAGFIGS